MSLDLDDYRTRAEAFLTETERAFYLHYSGQQDDYEIEAVFDRHADLFSRETADALRDDGAPGRLIEFAVEGHIGRETRSAAAELARREASLEIEWDGERLPLRSVSVVEANERDPDRRAQLEAARDAVTEAELNPVLHDALETSHGIARDLGWRSLKAMCEELSGIDLDELGRQTAELLEATEERYEEIVEPHLQEEVGIGFDRLRRSDLPAFFRAPSLDSSFPAARLMPALTDTLSDLGTEVHRQRGLTIDTVPRPKKSPRAFCSPVRVPEEVYLVISPVGGREDYAALFHEAGHTEHYAHMGPELAVEERYRGDNSVTECYAFLFEHLTADSAWLRRHLSCAEPEPIVAFGRASELVYLRRYAAKLAYELELHDGSDVGGLDQVYSDRLSGALHLEWPAAQWLADVDPFFYAARYLRAWALETHVRGALTERFGETWFAEPEAGDLLRELWSTGQGPEGGEGILAAVGGGTLDFSLVVDELT